MNKTVLNRQRRLVLRSAARHGRAAAALVMVTGTTASGRYFAALILPPGGSGESTGRFRPATAPPSRPGRGT
jgi:hypothetical protein